MLAFEYLCQIAGKILLVGQLDLVQLLQHGLVVGVLVQLGQIGSIVLVAVADGLVQQLAQAGVRGQQPAAVCNAVGHVLEGVGVQTGDSNDPKWKIRSEDEGESGGR